MGGNSISYGIINYSGLVMEVNEKTALLVILSLEKKRNLYSHLAYANAEPGGDFLDQHTVASL